MLKQPTTP